MPVHRGEEESNTRKAAWPARALGEPETEAEQVQVAVWREKFAIIASRRRDESMSRRRRIGELEGYPEVP